MNKLNRETYILDTILAATLSIFGPPPKIHPNEARVSEQQTAVAFLKELVILNSLVE